MLMLSKACTPKQSTVLPAPPVWLCSTLTSDQHCPPASPACFCSITSNQQFLLPAFPVYPLLQGAPAAPPAGPAPAPGPAPAAAGNGPVLVPGVFRAPSPTTATAALGRPVAVPPPHASGSTGVSQAVHGSTGHPQQPGSGGTAPVQPGPGLMTQGSGYSSSQAQVSVIHPVCQLQCALIVSFGSMGH
jgi:hypothetical protein